MCGRAEFQEEIGSQAYLRIILHKFSLLCRNNFVLKMHIKSVNCTVHTFIVEVPDIKEKTVKNTNNSKLDHCAVIVLWAQLLSPLIH